jgi:hypothetical protein
VREQIYTISAVVESDYDIIVYLFFRARGPDPCRTLLMLPHFGKSYFCWCSGIHSAIQKDIQKPASGRKLAHTVIQQTISFNSHGMMLLLNAHIEPLKNLPLSLEMTHESPQDRRKIGQLAKRAKNEFYTDLCLNKTVASFLVGVCIFDRQHLHNGKISAFSVEITE